MSFDLVSDFLIVVQGQIGELNGLRFILDTGSSHSVIDRRVADRMRLHRRPGTVFSFERNLLIEWVNVPEVRIGPICALGTSMIVARLADLSEFAENVDGIIGLDVMSRAKKIAIDYRQRRISIKLDEARGIEPSATKAFVVPMLIQGFPMRLIVDTGLQYVLLYKDRFRSILPHLRTEGEPRNAVIGRLQGTQVNLPGVSLIGPEAVTPVFLIEGPGNTDLGDVDGYLGPASLHAKRLELNFAAMTLRWQ